MRKPTLIFVFLFAWLSSFCQDFPMPMYYYTWFTDNYDSVVLKWNTPPNQTPSYYNLYYFGDNDGLHLPIGSSVDTAIAIPTPDFVWKMNYGLTAVYSDPYGESDTCWAQFIAGTPLKPIFIDFEDKPYCQVHLVESVKQGGFCWRIYENESYSPEHSAAFIADSVNYISSLRTASISAMPEETLKLSFMYRIPVSEGQTDTLRLFRSNPFSGPWVQLGETYHSTDEWQLASFTFDPGVGGRFSFTATAGGGAGVFIDDILIEDISTGVAEHESLHNGLRISLNPAINQFSVQIPDNLIGSGSQVLLQVFDLHGRLHHNQRQNIENNRMEVNSANWPEGLHVLRLVIDGAVPLRSKVMVVK
jgi:hypothetical protein